MEDRSRLSPLKQAYLALEDAHARIAELEGEKSEPIAIVGIGCRFPGDANSPDSYWKMLSSRMDAICNDVPKRWELFGDGQTAAIPEAARSAGLIDRVDEFDAQFFGISPREATGIDPQQRLLLEVSWEALEQAGIAPTSAFGTATGVYFGVCTNDYAQLMLRSAGADGIDAHFASGVAHSVASGRVSYVLGLQGPSLSIDTACSSSLVAVHLACEGLRRGDCEMALAGGVNLILTPEASIAYARAGMLAGDGRVKAFDGGADGFVRGEGCGVVVLKRFRDAEAAGDRVWGVIRGSAVNQDGPSSGLTVPNGLAQQALLRQALENAGVRAEQVGYVEAHGTGTALGDPIEAEAIGQVYGAGRKESEPLWIGSVKTNLGHLEAAAGMAGLIKVVLGLEQGEIPAQLHWRAPSPHIRWSELAVRVVSESRAWERIEGRRIAGVSSFGFSGTNAHVIVEEAPARREKQGEKRERSIRERRERSIEVLTITGRTPRARQRLAQEYAAQLEQEGGASWADICHTANVGRAHWGQRVSVQARSKREAAEKLRAYGRGEKAAGVVEGSVAAGAAPAVEFVYPGRGLPEAAIAELKASSSVFAEAWERSEDSEAAVAELWKSWGVAPRRGGGERSNALRLEMAAPAEGLWEWLAAELQRLDAAGVEVDWKGWDAGYERQRVSVPLYPFERQRYWVEKKKAPDEAAYPLLGRRLRSALEAEQYETELRGGAGWVEEHRVGGRAVLPAAGLLEMLLETGRREWRDFVIVEPLEWASAEERPTVQVVLDEAAGPGRRARIFSWARAGEGQWRLHAEAWSDDSAFEGRAELSLKEAQARCGREQDRAEFYAGLAERGLEFGAQFQGLQRVWSGEGEALGEVKVSVPPGAAWVLYPPLLDACLQVAGALAEPDTVAANSLYLPFGIEHFQLTDPNEFSTKLIHRPPWRGHSCLPCRDSSRHSLLETETVFSHVRLTSLAPDHLACDLTIFDSRGTVLASLRRLQFRGVKKQTVQDDIRSWLYRVVWEPTPMQSQKETASLSEIAAAVEPKARALSESLRLPEYDAFFARLEELSLRFTVNALRRLGLFQAGEQGAFDELVQRCGVTNERSRTFRNLLNLCAEADIHPESNPEVFDCLNEVNALKLAYPFGSTEIELVAHCGAELDRVLTGHCNPQELLFGPHSSKLIAKAYRDSLPAQFFNQLVAETMEQLIGKSGGTTVRILEIGAGTGATTSYLLPLLQRFSIEYFFTDVSPFFMKRARIEMQTHPEMQFRTIDIESEAIADDLVESFDFVIAANVLHATADLKATLANVRRFMKPAANLLLLEIVGRHRWADITLGLSVDWLKHRDTHLRPDSGILLPGGWARLLKTSGFTDVVTVPSLQSGLAIVRRQELIVARKSSAAPQETGTCLIVAGEERCGRELEQGLIREGIRTAYVLIGELSRPPDSRPNLDYVGPWKRVVFVCPRGEDASPGEPALAVLSGCRVLLDLLRTLSSKSIHPQLSVVTQNAYAVERDSQTVDPAQTAFSGFASVIALEQPDFRTKRIDVGRERLCADMAGVVAEILAENTESFLAYRNGQRYCGRLEHDWQARKQVAFSPDASVRLQPAKGGLKNLMFARVERSAPSEHEVEIEVRAAALNFRDVMNAIGARDDPEPMGTECSGVVTRIGSAVTDLRAGDEVFAIAPGTFATFALANSQLTFRKPSELSFEAAAALPVAYLTADFCLTKVAGIRAGEKVLIHAAAGGVGLAALHLSQAAGAEVYATAGSEKKRQYLRSLGVEHVFNSRSKEFAEAIHENTGGAGVDVVLNSLTGAAIDLSLSLLRPGGRFLEIGKADIRTKTTELPEYPGVEYHAVDLTSELMFRPGEVRARLHSILRRVQAGELAALPTQVFAWDEISEAFRIMAAARHVGKVVVGSAPPKPSVAIDPEAGYLVTGGMSGIGLRVAIWLAGKGARHLVLLGRRGVTGEAAGEIDRMQRSGVTVHAVAGDVCKSDDLRRAVGRLEGRHLKGIFHCAGVLSNASLFSLDAQGLERVLRPKVDGAWNLHTVSAGNPLDYFVLFSSWASIAGSLGQASHCTANSFLDGLAQYRHQLGLPAISINWGAWSDVGSAADPETQARFQAIGVEPFHPKQGLAALESLLGEDSKPQVGVMPIRWSSFLAQFQAAGVPSVYANFTSEAELQPKSWKEKTRPKLRERLAQTSRSKQDHALTAALQEMAASVLGMRSGSELDPECPLGDLGMDSLLAVELRNAISAELGTPLPATILFDYPTILSLSKFLISSFSKEEIPGTSGEVVVHDDVLSSIEKLSDDQADALLAAKGITA